MAWDQEGENHEGETVFALVPDKPDRRSGKMLRDRGYAEIVPVAGQYTMTDEDELYLETPYDGGAVEETFTFDGINMCNRVSNVRRFGGIATATFSTEERLDSDELGAGEDEVTDEEMKDILSKFTLFGTQTDGEMNQEKPLESNFLSGSRERFASAVAASKNAGAAPSTNSAFGSGFSARAAPPAPSPGSTTTTDPREEKLAAAAQKAGIDLSKIPPSMRVEFERSFDLDNNKE